MKINDIKSALNNKVSAMNIQAPSPTPTAPAPKKNNNPAPVPATNKPAPKPTPKVEPVPVTVEAVPDNSVANIEFVVAKILKPNADYGIIPGCRKPSLLKSGAEKLAAHFGFSTSISIENRLEDYDKRLVAYEIKVTVYDTAGRIIAEGIGAANSQERKFLKGDFFSQINTVTKMAKKRAYVDALLTATGSSGIFTQDMEDISNVSVDNQQEAI